ncbi:PAS domain-containing protein [Halorubellus litoreus]|uniref:histidine kinase n=1 Tax=Halorubellus litoreus TaxID=755308 RepID=A0ABD5VEW2_9EURY
MSETPVPDPSEPVLDRVEDVFFALDTDWRFTYLNDRAESLLWRSREDLLGRVMWDEFPETVETQFPESFHEAMETGDPVAFDVYHKPLNTWFEARAYPGDHGLSVFMQDVTDRRTRKRKLDEHARVVEAVNDGVIVVDTDNHVASVNEAIEDALSTDRESLVGEHVDRLHELAAVDARSTTKLGQAVEAIRRGDTSFERFELSFRGDAGDERIGEVRMVPLDEHRERVAGVVRDVTDQREYERVVERLHDVTRWLFQAEDAPEICSVATHATGKLLGLPISGVWLIDDERGVLDPIAATAGAHEELGGLPQFPEGDGLVWEVYRDGEPRLFDDVHDHDGRFNEDTPLHAEIVAPLGAHGVVMTGALEPDAFDEADLELVSLLAENTTAALDRMDREQLLDERRASLEEQRERLGAVADILSEDLQAHLETAADDLASVSAASEGAPTETLNRAEALVDDILEFAKDSATLGSRESVGFESALADALDGSLADDMTVYLEFEGSLRADRDRLVHMLETFFNDIHSRAQDAGATVRIGPERAADGRPDGFYILDDAAEIPETEFDRVFEPQGSSDAGVGLGLPVARQIAQAHGWDVDVTTGDPGGTRFSITSAPTFTVDRE